MKKIFIAALAVLLTTLTLSAREDRSLIQGQYNAINDKAAVFKTGGAWLPYPEYSDREGWKKIVGTYKNKVIKNGVRYLKYRWQYSTAYSYIQFEKDGNRGHHEPYLNNYEAFCSMILAELAEGQGRFIPQLINGIYYFSMMPTWNAHAHTGRDRVTNRNLPNPDVRHIALEGARTGATFALCLHFFKDEFDKVDPMISQVAYKALETNIFEPYLNEWNYTHGHEWLGFNRKEKGIGNWTTYCNTFITFAFLLCEKDQDDLLAALKLSTWSMDQYLDGVGLDGACDEGPSYWNMAGGKVYDYARMMYEASAGAINLFTDDQVRRIGEWKSKTHIGDGWVVPFGDGAAHNWGDKAILFRYGEDVGSQELKNFSIYLLTDRKTGKFRDDIFLDTDPYRALETMRYQGKMAAERQAALDQAGGDFRQMMVNLRQDVTSEWYPDTQHAVLRNDRLWFLGAKAGHNDESHNHNDVGSGIFFIEYCPVLIDPGVATYGKNTFGKNRYKQWNVRSEWHNLPLINGMVQHQGREYAASNTVCDIKKNTFSTDFAGAYPKEAGCRSWHRTYKLAKKDLTITDKFDLEARTGETAEYFITQGRVFLPGERVNEYIVKKGEVVIEARDYAKEKNVYVSMKFPAGLVPTVEAKPLEDRRLSRVWGDTLYRLKFTAAADAPLTGTYMFKLIRMYL